jgi:hypothetical protein
VTTHRAECSCGGLAAIAHGEPVRVSVCHCLACQRRTGSVFGAQARFPRAAVTVEGTSTEFVRRGDSGETTVRFHFCPACGATVWYTFDEHADMIAIPVGAFADPQFPPPTFSVYEARKHGWVALPEPIEHMD